MALSYKNIGSHLEGRLPSGIFFPVKNLLRSTDPGRQGFDRATFPTFPRARIIPCQNNVPAAASLYPPTSPTTISQFPPSGSQSASEEEEKLRCLPLLDVSAEVSVECTIASTKLVQRFTNISDIQIEEARYTFPLYDGSVVTSFRCHIGESKVLVGTVKPSDEAKRVYKVAVKNGKSAALLQEHTPEVFETLVGNIPPETAVSIEIIYINELKSESMDGAILLTIPTSIAPRYGSAPANTWANTPGGVTELGLSIVVRASMAGNIKTMECRSHPVSIEMGSSGQKADEVQSFAALGHSQPPTSSLDPKKAIARLADRNAALDKDFVLRILTHTQSMQVSQALISPVNSAGHAAMMVTIKPAELFSAPESFLKFSGDIIFLADRSGSMEGKKISTLREALQVFLKSLPETCRFNLVGFGDSISSLWESPMQYNQNSLDTATQYVSSLNADMGGTDLLPALRKCSEGARDLGSSSSTQIIALTDGEVWDTDSTIDFVRQTRTQLGAKIRFFALGIGDQVSHRLIEGIGTNGGGFGEVVGVDSQGKWQHRVIGLLDGALSPESWECELDLGPGFSKQNLLEHEFDQAGQGSLVHYAQGPRLVPPIHQYSQKSIFILLNLGRNPSPARVHIIGRNKEGGTQQVDMPLATAELNTTAIEQLAAGAILASLDEESAPLFSEVAPRPIPPQTFQLSVSPPGVRALPPAAMIRKNGESISCLYSISSKWTNFVAVDQSTAAVSEGCLYSALADRALADRATEVEGVNTFYMLGPSVGGTSPVMGPHELDCDSPPLSMIHHTSEADVEYPPRRRASSSSYKASRTSASSGPVKKSCDRAALKKAPRKTKFNYYHWIRPKPPSLEAPAQAISLDWNRIVACQTASGAFRLDDEMRKLLDQHFCPGAREWLTARFILDSRVEMRPLGGPFGGELQLSTSSLQGETEDTKALSQMTFDTLAMVIFVSTHFVADSGLWKMMIVKGRRHIRAEFRACREWLTYLSESIRHAHVGGRVLCTICDRSSRHATQKDTRINVVYDRNSVKCSYPDCEFVYEMQYPQGPQERSMASERIFEHQMHESHLYCAEATPNARGEQASETADALCAPGTSKEPAAVMENEVVDPSSQDVAMSEQDQLKGES